jgi:hypothetical protein
MSVPNNVEKPIFMKFDEVITNLGKNQLIFAIIIAKQKNGVKQAADTSW